MIGEVSDMCQKLIVVGRLLNDDKSGYVPAFSEDSMAFYIFKIRFCRPTTWV